MSLLNRIAGTIVGIVALVLAFVFSIAIFALLLTAVAIGFGYVWWKTRALRRAQKGQVVEGVEIYEAEQRMRSTLADRGRQDPPSPPPQGRIIDQ